jgi:hypothetical protein
MTGRRPPVAWGALLAWCGVTGYYAFARGRRVPLLSLVDWVSTSSVTS